MVSWANRYVVSKVKIPSRKKILLVAIMSKILVSEYGDLTKKLYAKVLIEYQIPNFLEIINYTVNLQCFTSDSKLNVLVATFMPFL